MSSIAQALRAAQTQGLERLDAQLLLLHALGQSAHARAWLMAHDAEPLPAPAQARFDACVQRRQQGEPLAYITGHKEFFGLDLRVDARVLVPRPDTETLVEWALEVLNGTCVRAEPFGKLRTGLVEAPCPAISVIDLGTGSGAIALALKHSRPDAEVTAVDLSSAALDVARANAHRLGLNLNLRQSCWFAEVNGSFELIVSNPPYIAAQDPHLAALTHEPLQALVSGTDGLHDIGHIISQAVAHLQPAGWLLLEHGWDQAQAVRGLLLAAGFCNVESRRDWSGIERCSGGQQA